MSDKEDGPPEEEKKSRFSRLKDKGKSLKDKAGDKLEVAKDKASVAKDKASDVGSAALEKAKAAIPAEVKEKMEEYQTKLAEATEKERALIAEKAQLAKELAEQKAQQAKAIAGEKAAQAKKMAEEKKQMILEAKEQAIREAEEKITRMVDEKVDKVLEKIAVVVKEGAHDPEMPKVIHRAIDLTVDSIWPDVKEEVKMAIAGKIRKQKEPEPTEPPKNFLWSIRAFILYHLFPCDKSIWRKIKDPFYWLLTAISLVPLYSIPQMYYLLILLLKDKGDEFQLVEFILGFKGIQFITLGLIAAAVGGVKYYTCATLPRDDAVVSTCEKQGPKEMAWTFLFFCVQIILVWIAFAMLPYSVKKGGKVFEKRGKAKVVKKEEDEKELEVAGEGKGQMEEIKMLGDEEEGTKDCCGHTRYKNRGGRLGGWIVYDTICFALCAALIVVAGSTPNSTTSIAGDPVYKEDLNWRFQATLYWSKVLYGILSFPFILFKLPVLGKILTHAKPTAYDRHGHTVPINVPKPPKAE